MTEWPHFDADRLRPVDHITEPDPRNACFVSLDDEGGHFSPLTLQGQHNDIASVALHPGVPEDIVAQLETTKNLYLYAWFIYRFYAVAQHHALTCLELGLRARFWDDIRAKLVPCLGKKPMLKDLLRFAISTGVVTNQGFAAWHEIVRKRARLPRGTGAVSGDAGAKDHKHGLG